MTPVVEIIAVVDGKPAQRFVGRVAWTLHELVTAGERGCTPIDNPAPRWSGYIHRLRQEGVCVETIHETHGGAYSGHHARYRLASKVALLEVRRAGEGRRHAA